MHMYAHVWRQSSTLGVFFDNFPLYFLETGSLTESAAHRLATLPGH